jgi:Transposase DDE domain
MPPTGRPTCSCWSATSLAWRSWATRPTAAGETRALFTAAGHAQTIKPALLAAEVPGGFTKHDLAVDPHAGTVTCPAGYRALVSASGQASFARCCQRCPLRERCTTATSGRRFHLHPHEDELRAAHRRATTHGFQDSYWHWRPMVERSIAWLVADGCRRVPYRGIERNHLWLSVRVAALNLGRLLALGLARRDGAWVLALPVRPATAGPNLTVQREPSHIRRPRPQCPKGDRPDRISHL